MKYIEKSQIILEALRYLRCLLIYKQGISQLLIQSLVSKGQEVQIERNVRVFVLLMS